MAPQKSPAFSFYAKDFLSGTARMSLQEVGAYIRLLSYAWDDGNIPNDANERARLMVCSKAQERELWKKVGLKFVLRGDVYINERLEEERRKQVERRQRLADNGKQGGRPTKANYNLEESYRLSGTKPTENLNERLPSSSSFPSSGIPSKNDGIPSRPLISGESHPKQWGKQHGNHRVGFCDWLCLPEFLFIEFCRKSGQSDGGEFYVEDWAKGIRSAWEGRVIAEDGLKFWRARWTESHQTKAEKPKPKGIAEILAEQARRPS
jgi:uncharacterized protein YdaU (DUF1376 family)